MAGRAALLDRHAPDAAGMPFEQLRRAQPAGEQDRPGRDRHRGLAAIERGQHAVGHLLEIGQPLAQIRVLDPPHPLADLVRHPVDRRFGGQAAHHGFVDPAQPALVGRDQTRRLEHLAGAIPVGAALLDQFVERFLDRRRRGHDPRHLGLRILRQQPADRRAHAMQHDRPDRQARRDRRCRELPRQHAAEPIDDVAHPARGEQLGQQHRHRLEHVDLVVGIAPRQPVLHRQHAHRAAGSAQWQREQRGERVLAGLRAVGEGRMALRVRQVLHRGRRRRDADDALAHPQPRAPDRVRIEALCRGQFQRVAVAHRVDGAHLGRHLGGDQHREVLQRGAAAGRWRRAAGGHHLAQPSQ